MKSAKVFRSGNSQAIRLPKEFRVPEGEVYIRKSGDTIILIPKKGDRWKNVRGCAGAFKGSLTRQPPTSFDDRTWPE
jgi:antitoxin VapB